MRKVEAAVAAPTVTPDEDEIAILAADDGRLADREADDTAP